jgi:hypothetical protein
MSNPTRQSFHDIKIQRNTRDSIMNMINDPQNDFNEIDNLRSNEIRNR